MNHTFHFTRHVVCALFAMPLLAHAAVTAEEAAKLKTTLTPVGAERAGNKDGSIPSWDGGITKTPAGYKPGTPRTDLFEGDKPIYSVTAKNMEQHVDKLSEGVKALFKKYPDSYRIDVYKAQRTAALPQWVYDNTFKNATRAVTKDGGNSLEGAYGGTPFPIPKTGNEAMWNAQLLYQGEAIDIQFRSFIVTTDGKRVMASASDNRAQFPYYYKDGSLEAFKGDFRLATTVLTEPPVKNGEAVLVRLPVDMVNRNTQTWQYLPGQRRVRKAPNILYDAPNFITSGISNFDEIFLFSGAQDRYDWKLMGKREMLIPYNNNKMMGVRVDELIGARHVNPDHVRWELHRVWVVEANLAAGKRNVVSKRTYYLDEDSWQIVLGEGYDGRGQLWKVYFSLPAVFYDFPMVAGLTNGIYDLQAGSWLLDSVFNELPSQYKSIQRLPESHFTPDNLATLGVR